MEARNRIWEELKQTKANIVCLQRYTDKGRMRLRIADALIVSFAAIGALGGSYCHLIAVIGASAVAVMSILKPFIHFVIQSEQELSELDRLMDFYAKYFNKLEKLWYEYHNDKIKEDEMIDKLFAMKEEECDKYSLMNKGIRSISETEQNKINEECAEYINRVYFKLDENDTKQQQSTGKVG
jgi:hypothetical protein